MNLRSHFYGARTSKGHFIALASSTFRNFSFTIQSNGAVVLLGNSKDDAKVVYSGSGWAEVRCSTDAGFLIAEGSGILISIPELRDHMDAGWTNDPSMTDLEPRPMGALSPEIRAVMDQMNRNAIIREQAMLKSLGRR